MTYVTETKDTGTVIQDSLGNEFVWVPASEESYVRNLSYASIYDFAAQKSISDDSLPQGIINEASDVKKYGGFYVGRYETGIPAGDVSPINKEGTPVIKKDTVVWTNIDYISAKKNAENMISNEYVQTGIVTGTAWDTICEWINSPTYGNFSGSEKSANVSGYGSKHTSGFSEIWKAQNIYDLAGNVWEWTSEVYNTTERVRRGGAYNDAWHGGFGDSYRSHSQNTGTNDNLGFRIRLYMK